MQASAHDTRHMPFARGWRGLPVASTTPTRDSPT